MNLKLLLAYSTVDGHTLTICQYLKAKLASPECAVKIEDIDRVDPLSLSEFDLVVIGASIRYGRHAKAVYDFIDKHQNLLNSKPSAFFSVNLVARKAGKDTPLANPYTRRFLQNIPWKPHLAAVFAGRLDYPRYGFWDRHIIQLIMFITGGPTDPTAKIEFTDWRQVDAFSENILRLVPVQPQR